MCSSPAFHGVSALLQSQRVSFAPTTAPGSGLLWSHLPFQGSALICLLREYIYLPPHRDQIWADPREIQCNLPLQGSFLPSHSNLAALIHVPTGSELICLLRDPIQFASSLPGSDLRHEDGPWSKKIHPHAAHTSQFPASISNRTDFQSHSQGIFGSVSLFHKGTPQFQNTWNRISPTACHAQGAAQQP